MFIKSKYQSKCKHCGQLIGMGDDIWWEPSHGAVHKTCYSNSGIETNQNEKIIWSDTEIQITNHRFIFQGKVISIKDVEQAKFQNPVTNKILPIIFSSAGIYLVGTLGWPALIYPASLFFIGALFSYNTSNVYRAVVLTKTGNLVVLQDENELKVKGMVDSINNAIDVASSTQR